MQTFQTCVLLSLLLYFSVLPQQTRIVLFGDTQDLGYPDMIPPIENMFDYTTSLNPDLVHIAGDLNGTGSSSALWDTVFSYWRKTGLYSEPNTTFYPALGDHDCGWLGSMDSATAWANFKTMWQDRIDLPGNEVYYSVKKNNVYSIILGQGIKFVEVRTGNTQYNWLVSELEKANADPGVDWIVVTFHYPPQEISASIYGGASYSMPYLCKLFRDYNVDFVHTGHQHNLFRTYPVTFRDSVGAQPWQAIAVPEVVGPGEGTTFLAAARVQLSIDSKGKQYYHAIAVGNNTADKTGNTGLPVRADPIYKLEMDGAICKGYGVNTKPGYEGEVFDTFTVVPRPKTGGGGTVESGGKILNSCSVTGEMTVSPNPFKSRTAISIYGNPTAENIRIQVFNLAGQKLLHAIKESGQVYYWNAGLNPAGIYIVQASIGNKLFKKKIVLQK
jgi:hypothetical protein